MALKFIFIHRDKEGKETTKELSDSRLKFRLERNNVNYYIEIRCENLEELLVEQLLLENDITLSNLACVKVMVGTKVLKEYTRSQFKDPSYTIFTDIGVIEYIKMDLIV